MIKLNLDAYDITIGNDTLKHLDHDIKSFYANKDLFVITDQNVYEHYHAVLEKTLCSFHIHWFVIKPGEHSKSLKTYEDVFTLLIKKGMKRDHLLVAFGGGVVGDLTGFIAATLYRGVSYIQLPTSLLAMVDASIGNKTGIDTSLGKNLIGAFYAPKGVYIDTTLLNTLPKEEYENGLAEVLKSALIGDKDLFDYLKDNQTLNIEQLIQTIKVKQHIVLKDPYEKEERMFLNFGHTYGHAIEKYYDYQNYKHGQAVAYGMLFALKIGISLNITPPHLYDETLTILKKMHLVKEPLLKMQDYKHLLTFDKKNLSDGLRFILIEDVSKPVIKKVNGDLI